MIVRTVQQTRTSDWHTTAACSAQTSTISTADPSLSVTTAPMPTLVIRFGGGSQAGFVLAPAAPPVRPAVQRPYAPPAPRLANGDHGAPQAVAQAVPAAAAAAEPSPAAETAAAPGVTGDDSINSETKPAKTNRIELIIDSLPHHSLSEPIPVTIDPLGEEMFTASMRDLDIAATGNSIGEALLFLKEQIESTFDDLNRRLSHLSAEQKTTLQMLHTYIPSQHQSRRWF
jgi:hypothetical protein